MSPWGDTLTEQSRGDIISIDQQDQCAHALTASGPPAQDIGQSSTTQKLVHSLWEMSMCLEDKLERLCSIVNLQIDLGWREYLRDDRNNIFYYFFSLGLISREDLDAIYSGSGRLRANRHLRAFCAHLNYHFSPRYYRAEAVVDVGAGWGAITH